MIFRTSRRLAAVAVLAAVTAAVSGCGSSTLSDAATVSFRDARGNQTVHITRDRLLQRVEQANSSALFRDLAKANGLAPGNVGGETTDPNLTAFWLSQLINQTVIDAEFASQRLQISDADKSTALQLVQAGFARQQGDTAVFDAFPKAMRDELVDARARLDVILRSCASGRLVEHILVHTSAQAEAAALQIRKGAQFGDVARAKSIDKASATQGGVLGCVAPGEFAPEFQKAAEEAPFDTVTPPVKTQFGYHLILVQHWNPQLAASQQIAQALQAAAAATLDARVKALHVKVDPRFGSWGLHDAAQGQKAYSVAAPAAPTPRTSR
jgi:PPIC-type peptidyl-prolyl cis-trans isomerase-like protein